MASATRVCAAPRVRVFTPSDWSMTMERLSLPRTAVQVILRGMASSARPVQPP
jgi:hypothetical protein